MVEKEIAQDVTAYQSGKELAGSFGVLVTLRPSQAIEHAASLVAAELHEIATAGALDRRAAPGSEPESRRPFASHLSISEASAESPTVSMLTTFFAETPHSLTRSRSGCKE